VLPTWVELTTLSDYSRTTPCIDLAVFPGTPYLDGATAWFWTATAAASNPAYGWGVRFADGVVGTIEKFLSQRVRCVRPGP
jgi:hypothetical protein